MGKTLRVLKLAVIRNPNALGGFSFHRSSVLVFPYAFLTWKIFIIFQVVVVGGFHSIIACKQAHIWEHTHERQRANSKAKRSFGRSLVTRREESEPAMISVKSSFLLRLSEVKYHWSKSGKGDKTVNLLCFTRSD